jgi:hypothetical protein
MASIYKKNPRLGNNQSYREDMSSQSNQSTLIDKAFREIESPLSAFNNFQLQISDKLNDVVYGPYSRIKSPNQLNIKSDLIFNSDSIIVMGFLKLFLDRNEMRVQAVRSMGHEEMKIMEAVNKNFPVVETCFFQYIQMYNRIALSYNDVPNALMRNIVNMIERPKYHDLLEQSYFLIPYKSKVGGKVEGEQVFLQKLYGRFEYIIKFKQANSVSFTYSIYKVLSSDLNENRSLENVRFLENDLVHQSTMRMEDAEKFVMNLFCYGNLN